MSKVLKDLLVCVIALFEAEVGDEEKERRATAIIRDVSCYQTDSSAAQLSLSHIACSYSIHISHSLPPRE